MIPPGYLVVHNSTAFTGVLVLLKERRQPNAKVTPDMEAGEFHKGQIGIVVSSIDDWCLVLAPGGLGWCKSAMLTIRKGGFVGND